MTLSTPVKIIALAGLAVVLGLVGVLLLMSGHGTPNAVAVTPPHAAHPSKPAAPAPHRARVPVRIDTGVPVIVARVLQQKPVAVVVIYSSKNAGDRAVLAEARAGARLTHAGFVAADVANNAIASAVATWSPAVADPAVGIVRRPGKVVFLVTGPTDRQTVAQAVVSAR